MHDAFWVEVADGWEELAHDLGKLYVWKGRACGVNEEFLTLRALRFFDYITKSNPLQKLLSEISNPINSFMLSRWEKWYLLGYIWLYLGDPRSRESLPRFQEFSALPPSNRLFLTLHFAWWRGQKLYKQTHRHPCPAPLSTQIPQALDQSALNSYLWF